VIYVYGRPVARSVTVGGAASSSANAALLLGAGLALFMMLRGLGVA
jgi:hypothetical protein